MVPGRGVVGHYIDRCIILGPVEIGKLSFRLCIITYRLFALAETDAENFNTAYRLTVAGLLFVFVVHGAGIRRATYLCLDCTKNVSKIWTIKILFM